MTDVLFRFPMNVTTETLPFPLTTHQKHHRTFTNKHKSMLINASPIAVSNKIRAIQTRKSRINLHSCYDYTDIRPLNLTNQTNGQSTRVSPEKLVERSKELRLGRISTRTNPRPSVLSTTSVTNQTSLIWPSCNSQTVFAKETPSGDSPTTVTHAMNKSMNVPMPDIVQRSSRAQTITRQPLGEQQPNILSSIETRHQSLPKTKSSKPKIIYPNVPKPKVDSLQLISNENVRQVNTTTANDTKLYSSEEDDGEGVLIMDDEFKAYFQKAIVKCADWLMKYVIDKKYENDEDVEEIIY